MFDSKAQSPGMDSGRFFKVRAVKTFSFVQFNRSEGNEVSKK